MAGVAGVVALLLCLLRLLCILHLLCCNARGPQHGLLKVALHLRRQLSGRWGGQHAGGHAGQLGGP